MIFLSMASINDILSVYYQNVRGLRTKTGIRVIISASQHDVIAFTEPWLNDNFSSSEYFDDSYSVETGFRLIRGGVVEH